MKEELVKILDKEFAGKEPNIREILKIESDARVQKILSDIFAGEKYINNSELNSLSNCKFVKNLLYDYVDENLVLVNDSNLDDSLNSVIDLPDVYIKEAKIYPILTTKQEYKLGKMLKEGTKEEKMYARDKFILHNQGLVIKTARKYTRRGMEFIDLIQEGNQGLMEAINKFDVDYENKFSTYALWWIRQSITRGISIKSRTIRLPVHAGEAVQLVNRYETKFTQEFSHEPTTNELARYINSQYYFPILSRKIENDLKGCPNIDEDKRDYYEGKYKDYTAEDIRNAPLRRGQYSPRRIIKYDDCLYNLNFKQDVDLYRITYVENLIERAKLNSDTVVSYDANVNGDDKDQTTLVEFIADENELNNPELRYEKAALPRLINEMLDIVNLDPRGREVIRLRYGLALDGPKDIDYICSVVCNNANTKDNKEKVQREILAAEAKLRENPDNIKLLSMGEECGLSMYERELIVLKYGITTGKSYTLEDVGSIFKVTRERIRQIERNSFKRIKNNTVAIGKIKEYSK